ncbi:chromate efflux transporter [Neisseria animalis]|uniref:Chromate efflux transporter n=1 Tax=Neisseria animalis TaxID=492 RepID=A0A5P3MPD0_NEIAN|nr:chromate efflux transporter [Neisseria animalis]QEY23270.1 chromate efflux transporter [Neisseria animalis]ROW31975.1 chromate efflux transporter [Neisseria animalis]VEE08553.1 chromate transporter, chromate ion transporter (CHR) family [Neisseria animalis]
MNVLHLFWVFFCLGCTSFGGPIAHLGYFRAELVEKRRWLGEQQYADLVALCQIIPGPASSQVGIGIGYLRGGYLGAVAAWLGFTLPSAVLMLLFAMGFSHWQGGWAEVWIHSLKLFAVIVVAGAVWGMAKAFCRSLPAVWIAVLSCGVLVFSSRIAVQLAVIGVAALLGLRFLPAAVKPASQAVMPSANKRLPWLWLAVFAGLLLVLPWLADSASGRFLDIFYRTGAMVFGGGHVVLPVLSAQLVPEYLDESVFLSGYGLAQIVPGPLFSFASFLGYAAGGAGFAVWATLALFLPSFLLVFGVLPYWFEWSENRQIRAALNGINAAVVGLLAAALYSPIGTESLHGVTDVLLVAVLFGIQLKRPLPLWAVLAVLLSVQSLKYVLVM